MMICPQCQRTYSGEYAFCLSDGTPLVNATEEPTVVAPRKEAAPRRGLKILIFLLAGLLSLSLGITASVLYFFWPRSQTANTNQDQTIASASPQPTAIATATATATPSPQPTKSPSPTPARDDNEEDDHERDDPPQIRSDPGPTRVSFGRGRTQTSVSGAVVSHRSFLLYAADGQRLTARIESPGGCATFDGGLTSIAYTTEAGDNVVSIANNCEGAVRFRLRVAIR